MLDKGFVPCLPPQWDDSFAFCGVFLSGLALSLNRSFIVVYENSWSISSLTYIASFLASPPGRPCPDFDQCIFYPEFSCGRFILGFIRSLRFLVQFIDCIQSLLMVLFYFLHSLEQFLMALVQGLYMFNCDILFFWGHFLPSKDPPADRPTDYRPN